MKKQVLVFRNQHIEPQHQVAFSRRFGPLEMLYDEDQRMPGFPEVAILSNEKVDGNFIGVAGRSRQGCVNRGTPYGTDTWKTKIAATLGLKYTLQPHGRPRKVVGFEIRTRKKVCVPFSQCSDDAADEGGISSRCEPEQTGH